MICYLYVNVIHTLNFNIRLCCNDQFYKVNMNLKYPSDFIGLKKIDLNQIFYEDIEEVSDIKNNMEYSAFENNYKMQKILGFQTLYLIIFNFYFLLGTCFHIWPTFT